MRHYTRFRAYQLPNPGSSFSVSVDKDFTLIEARYNETNKPHIKWEMERQGIKYIDTLHITSWDQDHCNYNELCSILRELIPTVIEYPSENPTTENGINSKAAIISYCSENDWATARCITPSLVRNEVKLRLQGQDLFYNPIVNGDNANDNSVVKFFRVGSFQILSLGDCEDENIAKALMSDSILKNEVDVMILAHHGADNGFTTKEFLEAIRPKVCVCSSDYGNKYDHPRDIIRQRCSALGIPMFTTKRGDIIAQSTDPKHFRVANYVSNNELLDTVMSFHSKTWYIKDVEQQN